MFRHLLPGHPDAIADCVRNGRLDKIPLYARTILARGGDPYNLPSPSAMGSYGVTIGGSNTASRQMASHNAVTMSSGMTSQLAQLPVGGISGTPYTASDWDPLHMQLAQQPGSMGQSTRPQTAHQMSRPSHPQQPMQLPQYQMQPSLQYPQQGLTGMQYPTHSYEGYGAVRPLGQNSAPEMRICFPFVNKGRCERGNSCRFRHLSPDHPDAIGDRARIGRVFMPGSSSNGIDTASAAMGEMHIGSEGLPLYQSQVSDPFSGMAATR
mmetsp:Transcript_20450/g.62335  ORF Transcript_20450/g.62335 Transcript_20450/m.62335 type:complete len:266 (-) Transcript_20450:957-1754(-)